MARGALTVHGDRRRESRAVQIGHGDIVIPVATIKRGRIEVRERHSLAIDANRKVIRTRRRQRDVVIRRVAIDRRRITSNRSANHRQRFHMVEAHQACGTTNCEAAFVSFWTRIERRAVHISCNRDRITRTNRITTVDEDRNRTCRHAKRIRTLTT